MRIPKNINTEVEEENNDNASDAIKTIKALLFINTGMPVSFLVPPGSVKAVVNMRAAMRVATTMHEAAVLFIQLSPCFTNSACSSIKT